MNNYHDFPFATLEQNADSPVSYWPDKIKIMLMQVSRLTQQFLDNLSYIYKSNSINFKIKEYHGLLIRMLSPFELLSQFGLNDNKKLFSKPKDNSNSFQNYIKKPASHKETNRLEDSEDGMQFKQIKKLVQKQVDIRNQTVEKLKQNECKNGNSQNRLGRESLLGQELEATLCEWIKEQIARTRSLSSIEIIDKARALKNDPNFVGSRGWYNRFINRHPEVKKMIENIKNKPYQKTQKRFLKSSPMILKRGHKQQDIQQNSWFRAQDQNEECRSSYLYGSDLQEPIQRKIKPQNRKRNQERQSRDQRAS